MIDRLMSLVSGLVLGAVWFGLCYLVGMPVGAVLGHVTGLPLLVLPGAVLFLFTSLVAVRRTHMTALPSYQEQARGDHQLGKGLESDRVLSHTVRRRQIGDRTYAVGKVKRGSLPEGTTKGAAATGNLLLFLPIIAYGSLRAAYLNLPISEEDD